MSVFVTKSFLPTIGEYTHFIQKIFDSHMLTNQGPLVQELEEKLGRFLGVQNLHYVTNGTIALQLALSALDIKDGEVITTPFSYVATTGSILWERCRPVFVDIEPDHFTIDADKIEAAITPHTRAIMPVHVFGYACDVEKIGQIANRHHLKVIYDGAHAFASRYKGQSLLSFGDITTCSFHATKLFHTVEGGACIVRDKAVSGKLALQKHFGHHGDDYFCVGINGKQSELHAAMGLANLPYIDKIIAERKRVSELYDEQLAGRVQRPKPQADLEYNHAYYPVVFKNEDKLLKIFAALKAADIFPRRYFWPSLNTLPYVEKQSCPISEDIASRIACLPLYPDLANEEVLKIVKIIKETI